MSAHIGTYRPADVLATEHPIRHVAHALDRLDNCTVLRPGGLDRAAVKQLLEHRFADPALAGTLAEALHCCADGNPLFLAALINDLVARERVRHVAGRWMLAVPVEEVTAHVPESLRELIEADMDRLDADSQRMIEAASVIGIDFDSGALAYALATDELDVAARCDNLARVQRYLRRVETDEEATGVTLSHYAFLHALYQQIGLHRSSAAQREIWHRRIAGYLESRYGEQVEEVAAELAIHLERTGNYARAAHYYTLAAERASARPAHPEAVRHFRRGLSLLEQTQASAERDAHELRIQVGMGPSLIATAGIASPDFEIAYLRARVLIDRLDMPAQLDRVRHGLAVAALARCQFARAQSYALELEASARHQQDAALLADSLWPKGLVHLYRGELASALTCLAEIDHAYDSASARLRQPLSGHDAAVVAHGGRAWALWMLGYPDQALAMARQGLTLALATGLPFVHANALNWLGITCVMRRETESAANAAAAEIDIGEAHGFRFWHTQGHLIQGWVRTLNSGNVRDLDAMEQAIRERQALAPIGISGIVCLHAEACLAAGEIYHGLAVVDEGLERAMSGEERAWLPELLRLKGDLLGRHATDATADAGASPREARECLINAIEAAQTMSARSWELRAALSLARLTAAAPAASETSAALARLAACYERFTEGWRTSDLAEAAALLGRPLAGHANGAGLLQG